MPSKQLNTDFRTPDYAGGETGLTFGDIALWDTALWDVGVWAGGTDIFRSWQSVSGIGRSASLRIKTSTKQTRPSVIAINYIYKLGGFLR